MLWEEEVITELRTHIYQYEGEKEKCRDLNHRNQHKSFFPPMAQSIIFSTLNDI